MLATTFANFFQFFSTGTTTNWGQHTGTKAISVYSTRDNMENLVAQEGAGGQSTAQLHTRTIVVSQTDTLHASTKEDQRRPWSLCSKRCKPPRPIQRMYPAVAFAFKARYVRSRTNSAGGNRNTETLASSRKLTHKRRQRQLGCNYLVGLQRSCTRAQQASSVPAAALM